MDIVSPLFAVIGLLIALIWGYFGVKITRPSSSAGRFETLDGLRGYLAIFVMFHHSAIWFHYIKENTWGIINSNLYTHFGQTSVGLFFMITAFLFFSKIMDAKDKPIDWLRLFISRFMRIVPLYLLVFGALLWVVAILSGFKLQEDGLSLFRNIMAWLSFGVTGYIDLNGVKDTSLILAGVVWTLPFEWAFYLALPTIAFLMHRKINMWYVALSLLAMLYFMKVFGFKPMFSFFLGGILAVVLAKYPWAVNFAKSMWGTLSLLVAAVALVIVFPSAYLSYSVMLISFIFFIIAAGNTCFGILVHPISKFLGEISYGIYLLHGLVLFVMFKFVFKLNSVDQLSAFGYWGIVYLCLVIVLTLAYFNVSSG